MAEAGGGPGGRRPDDESERRLRALREEAGRMGVVSAPGVRPTGSPLPRASAETGYYALPLLKKPTWTWEVPVYFFVGGVAGAAAVIGAVSRVAGRDDGLARDARWIAAVGGALSGALLTSDLGRPSRFIYMLRVFKRQSPMSVGAWILTFFSLGSGAAVLAQTAAQVSKGRLRLQPLANAGDAVAALGGLGMCTYTGVLIGATVVPAWNRHARLLPVHFGASALASGVALLELRGHRDPALRPLALLAAATETAIGGYIEAGSGEGSAPLREGASGWLTRLGAALAGPVPLLLRALPGGATRVRTTAALLTLAGSLVTRIAWMRAGAASTSDPAVPLQLDNPGLGREQTDATH